MHASPAVTDSCTPAEHRGTAAADRPASGTDQARSGERLATALALMVLTIAGLGLRVVDLGRESFWLDEAGRAAIAALPLAEVPLGVRAIELSPPLYHLLLAGWTRLVGADDVAVRLLSALLSTSAIPLTWLLGRRLVGGRAALLGAALAAVAPLYVTYGREAAMYALLLALALLSTWAWLRLLQSGTRPATAAPYLLITLALLYTHYYALFLLAAQNVVALVLLARQHGDRAVPRGWWALQWALALGSAPWAPVVLQQARLAASVEDWVAPSLPDALSGLAVALTTGPAAGWSALLVLVVFAPAVWAGLRAARARPGTPLVLAACALVPLALGLVAAYPLHAFRERGYIALAWLPQLLVAAGLVALASPPRALPPPLQRAARGLAVLYGAALVALMLCGALAALDEPKEDWRGAAARIALLARADDVVYLLHYAGVLPLDRYLPPGLLRRGLPADFGWARGFSARWWLEPADLDAPLAADRAAGRRMWAVLSHADGRGDTLLLDALDRCCQPLLREDFPGVRLGLWEPRPIP